KQSQETSRIACFGFCYFYLRRPWLLSGALWLGVLKLSPSLSSPSPLHHNCQPPHPVRKCQTAVLALRLGLGYLLFGTDFTAGRRHGEAESERQVLEASISGNFHGSCTFLWLGAQQPGAKWLWKPLTALVALSPPP
ncbi:hypothetical protein EWB00_001026, partial [Schistosoma japonicum]